MFTQTLRLLAGTQAQAHGRRAPGRRHGVKMTSHEKSLRREARYFGESAKHAINLAVWLTGQADMWRGIAAVLRKQIANGNTDEHSASALTLAEEKAAEHDQLAERQTERAVAQTIRAIANANLSIGER